jgi:tRNA(Ile)-lysidine synthase
MLEAAAEEQGLAWVHDDSNDDPRHARNAVRHRILPLLRGLNPAASANLARSAAHLAEAHELLRTVGRDDLDACASGERLRVDALLALGPARARNALRARLHELGVALPSTRRLDALMAQLGAREDGQVCVGLDGIEARRFRGELWFVRPLADPAPDFRRAWPGDSAWPLPELGGVLEFESAAGEGLDAALLHPGAVEVRVRAGGERLAIAPDRPHRSLKNLFQESALPPWERRRVPLVYCNGRLACVPGIGSDPALAPAPGAPGIRVRWTRVRAAMG